MKPTVKPLHHCCCKMKAEAPLTFPYAQVVVDTNVLLSAALDEIATMQTPQVER